ncbi:DUF5954 family protein [Micromonospora rosaria]|uniref:DUF5954 family protein n=1 Tax=Micromonospora rosaria TaxID=47874 RepID=UPI001FE1824F|nr:DUF5954 family protein [Micromonospora rosaria]
MRDDEVMPPVSVIRVARRDDPVSAVTEDDAARRAVDYPTVRLGGPLFGHAEELADGRWRLDALDEYTPQGARDALAERLRIRRTTVTEPALAAELDAVGDVLDWEKVDEVTVAGRRYRIVRTDTFARFGADGPEPPRPTDPDPLPPGGAGADPGRTEGLVVSPDEPTGLAHALLKAEVLTAHYPRSGVPAQVYADSVRAVRTHPGAVILPTRYAVAEYVDGRWQPDSAAVASPQAARDLMTFGFRYLVPRLRTPTAAETRAYARAAADVDATRADEVTVLGRRFRVTRIEILLRFGVDGPEGPRPSDHDPEPPPEAHCAHLRAQGLLPDPE